MTAPLVSVIIPTRDRLAFLKQAVGSVLAQTLSSCEAVVVDDASSDGTSEWLAEHGSERLTVVACEEHWERAIARNRGLEKARGQFVLFLDDDDRLRPSALGKLRTALAQNPDAIAAAGARVLFNEQGHVRRVRHPRRSLVRQVWTDLLAGWMSPPGTVLWRANVIRDAGAWNEKITLSGDQELWLRASMRGPIAFVPDVVLEKRTHGGQWRALEIREVHEQWRRAYMEGLPTKRRFLALRLSTMNRLLNDARIAYGNLDSRQAVFNYWQAFRLAPSILRSPLLGPEIARGIAKSIAGAIIGKKGVLAARWTKRALRRALGRDVEEVKIRKSLRESPGGTDHLQRHRPSV